MTLKESDEAFDSKLPKGKEIYYTDESSDLDTDPGTGEDSQGKQDMRSANEEQDFSGYVDKPENQDLPRNEIEDNAESRREPEVRLTRAGARRKGIYVEDYPLPRYCHLK